TFWLKPRATPCPGPATGPHATADPGGYRTEVLLERTGKKSQRPPGIDAFPPPWGVIMAPYPLPRQMAHVRSDPHPVRHRAGRRLGRGAASAARLRRATQARGGEAGPGKAGADPAGDGAGPRGLHSPR